MDVDSKPTIEETVLVGADMMIGPHSPLILPEIASDVLEEQAKERCSQLESEATLLERRRLDALKQGKMNQLVNQPPRRDGSSDEDGFCKLSSVSSTHHEIALACWIDVRLNGDSPIAVLGIVRSIVGQKNPCLKLFPAKAFLPRFKPISEESDDLSFQLKGVGLVHMISSYSSIVALSGEISVILLFQIASIELANFAC
ncbi:UNVERIFIED_CONTAM: hypothetical protein Scaly_2556700 [Sesamum calycinum]|uniref:DUF7803 domain-containing protein n=1 Tax=Sesamum calycinum TaxID=2727403 RepID=A0AAW2L8T6_9LAMI